MVVRVGVLAYDGCFASEVFTVLDLLSLANRVTEAGGRSAPFATSVHAARPGMVASNGGTGIQARRNDHGLDVLVVPGFELDPAKDVAARLVEWSAEVALLRRTAQRGVHVASVCVGAFLVAEAGLLDGRRATTAWLVTQALAERFPAVRVDSSALLVEDGPVLTTGAFSAGSDLALHLIRTHAGASVARATARITLTGNRTSQAPYVDERMVERTPGAFSARVRQHLQTHLDREYNLGSVAATHYVSSRTLLRRFRAETGQTPLDYLQGARVARARQLLETTDLTVAEVARAVGYGDVSTFRRLFGRTTGTSPSHYRRSFSG